MALKTDYKDYIPPAGGRVYRPEYLTDGTMRLADVAPYQQEGDTFGAAELNFINSCLANMGYNLLDNSNFANPVNQRGKTQYVSAGYTIDRWAIAYNTLNIIPGGGIQLVNAPGLTSHMYQLLPTNSAGQQRTLTVNTSDGVYTVSGVMSAASEAVKLETPFGYITFYISNGYDAVLVDVSKKTTTVFWIKLEAGSVSTPYVAKSYAEELNECLRFFYHRKAGVSLNACHGRASVNGATTQIVDAPFPVPMRLAPTCTFYYNETNPTPGVVRIDDDGGSTTVTGYHATETGLGSMTVAKGVQQTSFGFYASADI